MPKNSFDFLKLTPRPNIKFVLTDIDDTITTDGQLTAKAYESLCALAEKDFHVIPITGRPAGWCEMIARLWPVSAVVGENGGFYFNYDLQTKKMNRWYSQPQELRKVNQQKLEQLQFEILNQVPNCQISSDQFCRQTDLAIDFTEDIPRLSDEEIQKIMNLFTLFGATSKLSSIHVNGWFGDHTKLTTTQQLLKNVFHIKDEEFKNICAFSGDSPNDEPMFEYFNYSFGVANLLYFKNDIKHWPQFLTSEKSGLGFSEMAEILIQSKNC